MPHANWLNSILYKKNKTHERGVLQKSDAVDDCNVM